MQPIINLLVQLQELSIARAQQEVGMPGSQLDQLDASIAALTKELPDAVSQQFSRLLQKNHLAIVPVVNGGCTACGMALPVSLVHKVHAAEQIYSCPSCARMLFHRDSGARNTRKSPRRSDPPKVGIDRFSAETLMIPALKGTDRDSVLADLMAAASSAEIAPVARKCCVHVVHRLLAQRGPQIEESGAGSR